MKIIPLIFSSLFLSVSYSQVHITDNLKDSPADTLNARILKIEGELNNMSTKSVVYEKMKYNYVEYDSLKKYSVLGSLDKNGVPMGSWVFFYKNHNNEAMWNKVEVDNWILHGEWIHSWGCIQVLKKGVLVSQPCPNI